MTVVAADELDDLVAPGEAARHAQRAHRGLGARVDHAHELDRGDGLADEAGELDLEPGGRPEAGAQVELGVQGGEHVGVSPAEDHRPPRRDEVDELVAVGVPQMGAAAAAHEQRVRHADALHGAHRRVDPTGNVALRLVEQALRRVCVHSPPPCDGPRERLVIESTYYCVFARCDGSARFGRSRALVRPVTRWRGGLPRGSGGVLRKRRPPPADPPSATATSPCGSAIRNGDAPPRGLAATAGPS